MSSFLGSQGDQVDVIGLFMAARSEQISKRKFVCELDGQEFTTLNIMRVHFERKYAREAQAWWIQQSAQGGEAAETRVTRAPRSVSLCVCMLHAT